jgi:farnesyl diphosphate synthase|tara:strand:- start:3731 stop:4633 length:903 start_codon:yes stop_codon:yes gene_type:complete
MSNDNIEFNEFKHEFTSRIKRALDKTFASNKNTPEIIEPMKYSSLSKSKYIRSLLVYATGEALDIKPSLLDQPALAIELIHTYSLIHDDLPCMDDDDIRRGSPSCHIAYSESSAILAGDALQSLAFQILSEKKYKDISEAVYLKWINYLSRSIGYEGIAEGQYLDLSINNKSTELEYLDHIYSLKTSSLIKACIMIPAMLQENLKPSELLKLEELGDILGISFQIKDDLLGYTSSSKVLGKTQNKDEIRNQPNYVNLLGLDSTVDKLEKNKIYIDKIICDLSIENSSLHEISNYIFNRKF